MLKIWPFRLSLLLNFGQGEELIADLSHLRHPTSHSLTFLVLDAPFFLFLAFSDRRPGRNLGYAAHCPHRPIISNLTRLALPSPSPLIQAHFDLRPPGCLLVLRRRRYFGGFPGLMEQRPRFEPAEVPKTIKANVVRRLLNVILG